MDEFADIYYVDTRNATHDHRTGSSGARPAWRPTTGTPARTVYVPPTQVQAGYGAPVYTPQGFVRPMAYPTAYPAGQIYPAQSALAGLFGGMTTGQILDLVAVAFAALQPLPPAPTATKDAATDVGNLIIYQSALAQHAKRDEQVRTIGGLVSRLVG
jgi:hypothetical protein